MVVVEIMLEMKMVFVGPFDTQLQAIHWIGELVEANPEEKTLIAINENRPNSIQVYVGDQKRDQKPWLEHSLIEPEF